MTDQPVTETVAALTLGRYNRRAAVAASSPHPAAEVGVESVATVIAILAAIVQSCDALNPGWRDWIADRLPWVKSAGAVIRDRAMHAYDPDRAPTFARGRARRDRAAVLARVREQAGAGPIAAELMADAILDQIACTPARVIGRGVLELAHS